MKIALFAGFFAVLAVAATAAALVPKPLALHAGMPLRPHVALGSVSAITEHRPPGLEAHVAGAPQLADAARTRYGRSAQALVAVTHHLLPDGRTLRSTATVITWAKAER